VRQNQGQAQVEGLYEFTRVLGRSIEADQIVRIVLDQARDQLRAEVAELVLPAADGRPEVRVRMCGRGELDTEPLGPAPAAAWWTPALTGCRVLLPAGAGDREPDPGGGPVDGMAVPLAMDGTGTGVLAVSGSLPDTPTFTGQHLRLFQALANHAGVSLARARLVDRLKREVAEKEHLALHDPLTGLPNRRRFHLLLRDALGGEPNTLAAVMLIDLDRFKEVNDTLGHDTGDALLQEVGSRLRERLGARGVVARLGGDEFGVLLPGLRTRQDAVEVGQEVIREMERPIHIGHRRLTTRASIGIAFTAEHGTDAQTLLQRADVAMYAAKERLAGVRVYQPEDDHNTPRRLALIGDLREAIELRELDVVYQPKVDPRSDLVVGVEALARWDHRAHGEVAPDEFIALAEESGLMRPLTLQVVEAALRRCSQWREAHENLHVAVNLSPSGLVDSALPDVVGRLLAETGVPPGALTLEITETSLMADPKRGLATLDRLHALGVKLSIDDFGTGYSSLRRLRELPIDEVKIDRSFVRRLAVDRSDRAVVRSAVQLGHALGLEVVAEGVEDGEAYAYLGQYDCDTVQGFFLSKPLAAPELTEWLARHTRTSNEVLYPRFGT
jgi:diguanylate cyclase (GGDEF)-like protein